MERRLKERLIGAAVLAMLAVIFIPMILDDSAQTDSRITSTNIPPPPKAGFTSRIVPLPGNDFAKRPVKSPPAPEQSAAPASAAPGSTAPAASGPTASAATTAPPATQPGSGAVSPGAKPESPPATAASESGKAAAAPVAEQAQAKIEKLGMTAWVVQLGSFAGEDNAKKLNEKLRKAGYASYVERVSQNGGAVYRVRIGPELQRSQAESIQKKIKDAMSLDSIVLKYP